jgi:hypothetical protein
MHVVHAFVIRCMNNNDSARYVVKNTLWKVFHSAYLHAFPRTYPDYSSLCIRVCVNFRENPDYSCACFPSCLLFLLVKNNDYQSGFVPNEAGAGGPSPYHRCSLPSISGLQAAVVHALVLRVMKTFIRANKPLH